MHLISSLASGIRGAENGTVTFLLRGTATVSGYYSDFEATQLLPGAGVALDSYGALVAYVAALVDVRVYDGLGVLVREFVAGSEDAAVEVISPSFTGVDYASGASGVQKPTDLARVLDAWVTSAGAPDWNVSVNGTPTSLQVLAGNSFISVKAFGAQGNGVSDDTSAITAANAAATALGGATVYWPPGTYRATSAITLPANVQWVGAGGSASKLAIDSAIGAGAVVLPAAPAGSISGITGLWIGAINGATPGVLIEGGFSSTGEFHFTDCTLGNDALSNANLYANNSSLATSKVVFTRCYMKLSAGAVSLVQHYGAGRLTMRDCDLVSDQATGITLVVCEDGGVLEGNRFDASAATAGTVTYLRVAPTAAGGVAVIGNSFKGCPSAAGTAIYNSLAAPLEDCYEFGNNFGGALAAHTPALTAYRYATDGYAALTDGMHVTGAHGSRIGRVEEYTPITGATMNVSPKVFGTTIVNRTAGAALTIDADKGSMGDRWTLHLMNNTGALCTVTGGANIIFDVSSAPFPISLGSYLRVELEWLPSNAGVGAWFQTSKAYFA